VADDPGRNYWLKAIGHARGPLPEAWLDDGRWHTRLGRTGFPRRPRIVPGDRLVLYASVWKRVFGLAEVVGEVRDSGHERWPYEVALEALVVIPHLENAPPIEALGVMPRSMSQQSHISITARQYELAAEAIGSVGRG
jgi:hypothetical protein